MTPIYVISVLIFHINTLVKWKISKPRKTFLFTDDSAFTSNVGAPCAESQSPDFTGVGNHDRQPSYWHLVHIHNGCHVATFYKDTVYIINDQLLELAYWHSYAKCELRFLESPTPRRFSQQIVEANNKENIKTSATLAICERTSGFPSQRGSKAFSCHDVITCAPNLWVSPRRGPVICQGLIRNLSSWRSSQQPVYLPWHDR